MPDVQGEGIESVQSAEPESEQHRLHVTPRWLIAIVVVFVFILVLLIIWMPTPGTDFYASSRVLVSTARISEMDWYVRVFADENSDYAVFVQQDYVANQLPAGTDVIVGADVGRITETHDTYFVVSVKAANSPPGTVVYSGGDAVGFVSSASPGFVTCTYY